MNSPVEDQLRRALAEAAETVRVETIAPLRPAQRRRQVPVRALVVAVVTVALAVIVLPRLHGGGETAVAAAPPRDKADLTVFLCRKTAGPACDADERVDAIQTALREMPGVSEVHFEDRRTAYDALRAEYPSLAARLTPEDVPQAFRLVTRPDADLAGLARKVREMPGVAETVTSADITAALAPHNATPELAVFLCGNASAQERCGGRAATKAQKEKISQALKAHPEVTSVTFEDQETAYENFRETNKRNEALVAATRVSDMPESFRVLFRPGVDPATRHGLATSMRRMSGVAHVVDQRCLVISSAAHRLFGVPVQEIEACE